MAERLVHIDCRGRGFNGRPVLKKPIKVTVQLQKTIPEMIGVSVSPKGCPYNTGRHGQWCKASHPDTDTFANDIDCPYAFDYPYATRLMGWKVPHKVRGALEQLIA